MLQESLGGGGESTASAKRTLAQAQKLLQLASMRPNALTLREYRDGVEECLKPEGGSVVKVAGFQLAATAPRCTTYEVWKFVLEAVVMELGSSENTSTLAAAVSVLNVIPMPLVLGFLLSPEKEPMNKLRAVLTHEDVEVRCRAIETLSKLTLDVAIFIAGDGLFVFPFESHEARICCQQDVETMVSDCWKLIFQTLSFDGQSHSAMCAAGTAFTVLARLFARSSTMAFSFSSDRDAGRVQAPIDDVTFLMYKQAFPRIRALIAVARALPIKQQADAMLWISLLLYTMMERSGARCPSVSVPSMEIDTEDVDCNDADGDDDDDDHEPHTSTKSVRVDELVSGVLESWVFPTVSRRVSLTQATCMCRAIFILLAHPLQKFTRMRWAAQLANHLIAQCYLASKSSDKGAPNLKLKLDLCIMLVQTFAWLSGVNCQSLFVRTAEALYLLDHEKDRRDLVQTLMDTIAKHVVANRDSQLLQGLCAMTFFRQPKGFSRLSPRTNGSEVFRALCQALSNTTVLPSPSKGGAVEHQVSQLIALRVFRGLLFLKLGGSATTSPKAYHRSCEMSENIVFYTGLLTSHFQGMLAHPALALRESLDFFEQELLPAMDQIVSQSARLQVLWIGVRLHRSYASHVPFDTLVRELRRETDRLFTAIWNDDDEIEGVTFDSGLLGCSGASEEGTSASRKCAGDANNVDALMVLGDCITLLAQFQPHTQPQFLQMCRKMIAELLASGTSPAITSQLYRVIEDVMLLLSTPAPTEVLQEFEPHLLKTIFDPLDIFLPRKKLDKNRETGCLEIVQDETFKKLVTVSGSADPVSVQIAHDRPFSGHEKVVALEVSCCNLTTWALNDLEIQLCPLGGVGVLQCVDDCNDYKLRLLRAGETVGVGTSGGSTSLPPFGVIKAQKRFRVCKFTQVRFLVQTVLAQESIRDGDEVSDIPAEGASNTSIRLAFSDRYVLHFDTLLQLPQLQFATAAFFQHCWQSANSSVLWRVKSQDLKESKLGVCQRVLHDLNAKIAAVPELLLDLPTHFHIAMLTQTSWEIYVIASLTMNLEPGAGWSGVLEVRSSRENMHEFVKWPTDTAHLFGGHHVQLYSPSVASFTAHERIQQLDSRLGLPTPFASAASSYDSAFSTPLSVPMQLPTTGNGVSDGMSFFPQEAPSTPASLTFAPDTRPATSYHKCVRTSTDQKSFSTRTQQLEQTRIPEATHSHDDQWGHFL